MPEPTDETLNAWISPATSSSLAPDDINTYQDVIAQVVTNLTPTNSFYLVTVAHKIEQPEAKQWLTALVRTKKGDFAAVNNNELLARVACCIAVRILDTGGAPAALLGLLVQSAVFTGSSAPISELAEHANAAVVAAAIDSRSRPVYWTPIATEIANLLAEEPTAATEGEVEEPNGHEKALVRLAKAVDDLADRADERAKAVDEEYGALWWSYSGRSVTTGDLWDNIKPLGRRVALTAHELGQQMTKHPGPPMIRGLLGAALGKHATSNISLADVALAAADEDVDVAPKAKNFLLPISSAVAQIADLGSDGDTWKEVLDRSLGLKVTSATSALDAAQQLFREAEIATFLE